ncbi:MFS transporter [Frankia sp. Cppng1_Ct_nod]|uniref:MFS transporter n=1 Tax=Frankia sp. Cppng1_Ct_nod TaxID=2897162 RepID=UPI00104182A1|nr:MFS transporter [Frankia sp. Cppng1_Ct_nod]
MSRQSAPELPLPGKPTLRTARLATSSGFFVLGLVFASWAPRIPEVKAKLALSDGELGLALLGAPTGAVLTMWAVGLLLGRVGTVPVISVGLLAYCLVGVLVAAAGSPPVLFAVLALWGATGSGVDVALNAQAADVEQRCGRPIMSGLHAMWTAGALAGAGVGAAGAALSIPLGWQLVGIGVFGLVIGIPPTRAMLPRDTPAGPTVIPASTHAYVPRNAAGRARFNRQVATLCLICLSSFLCEGISADWSTLYLRDVTDAPAGVAGIGFVMFTVTMLVARLLGDRVIGAVGAARTVRVSAGATSMVFVLAIAVGDTGIGTFGGIIGFASIGLGMACVVPSAISAAGRVGASGSGPSAGAAVAAVISFGYVGWLIGPPLVGGLAELAGLHTALLVVVVLTATVAVLAPVLSD